MIVKVVMAPIVARIVAEVTVNVEVYIMISIVNMLLPTSVKRNLTLLVVEIATRKMIVNVVIVPLFKYINEI